MSILHALSRSLSAAVLAGSAIVAVAPAQAAVVASFDPAFGPSIPNLGFRGSVTFDVAAACYAAGPGIVNVGPESPCQITPTSGQVNFYDIRDPNEATLSTVNLDASSFPNGYVIDGFFDFTNDQLAGLDTNDSDLFQVNVAALGYQGSMILYFTTPFSQVDPAYLRNCQAVEGPDPVCNGQDSLPAGVVFTAVPEPDSIALAALGLAALVAGRRRRAPLAR